MNTATTRYALHLNIASRIAHIVAIHVSIAQASPTDSITGVRFGPIEALEDFLADAINETHSDASGMIDAAERFGNNDMWLEIPEHTYTDILQQEAIVGEVGDSFNGFALEAGELFACTGRESRLLIPSVYALFG